MDSEIIEVAEYHEKGYRALIEYSGWRVAVLNYIEKYAPGNIEKMDKHLETDEVFVLLSGSCKLLLAGKDEAPNYIEGYWMEYGKIYNIRKGVWHSHILLPGSSVLVVENTGTDRKNTSEAFIEKEISIL
jgi:ureidoglycolate hydrolase